MQKSKKKNLRFTHSPVPKDGLFLSYGLCVCLTMWSSWGCKHQCLQEGGWALLGSVAMAFWAE